MEQRQSGPDHRCLPSTRFLQTEVQKRKEKVSTQVSTFAISTLWVPTIAVTTSSGREKKNPRSPDPNHQRRELYFVKSQNLSVHGKNSEVFFGVGSGK